MTTAVDSNILIDFFHADPVHGPESRRALDKYSQQGALVICEAVYSEVAPLFEAPNGLNRFLAATGVRVERSSDEALYRAGRAWRAYSRQRPRVPTCPRCGASQQLTCGSCGAPVQFRQHTLADFLIGGHATVHADRLLTRDRRSYARYFPELTLA